jgi:hypothetical protein
MNKTTNCSKCVIKKIKSCKIRVYAIYGGSFLVDVPFPKSPYNSVKMTMYFDNLVGNYMVVDELKNPHENKPF